MTLLTIPACVEEITPEWLTRALRSRGRGDSASVTSCRWEAVGEGKGFVSQVVRLSVEYDGDGHHEGLPRTMIAKLPSPSPEIEALTTLLGDYQRETRFYEEAASRVAVETPECYYSAVDPGTGRTILLIEDLSQARLGDSVAGCSMAEARLVVRRLARLQAPWWDAAVLDRLDWMPLKTADTAAYRETYSQAWSMLARKAGGGMPDHLAGVAGRLEAHIPEIRGRLSDHPRTIVHGDYRLDNLLFGSRDGRATVIVFDWEFCTRGRGTYDLATFIAEAFPPEVRREEEAGLLRLYHSALLENGVRGYSYDQCLLDYRFSMLDLLLFWIVVGGYCDFGDQRATRYLHNTMERFSAAIADHGSVGLLYA